MDFVSPENVRECVQLTEEFRLLPKNHRSKEDKLEVRIRLSGDTDNVYRIIHHILVSFSRLPCA